MPATLTVRASMTIITTEDSTAVYMVWGTVDITGGTADTDATGAMDTTGTTGTTGMVASTEVVSMEVVSTEVAAGDIITDIRSMRWAWRRSTATGPLQRT